MSLEHVTDGLLSGYMHLSIAPELEVRATGRYGRDARTDWQGSMVVLEEVIAGAALCSSTTSEKQPSDLFTFVNQTYRKMIQDL